MHHFCKTIVSRWQYQHIIVWVLSLSLSLPEFAWFAVAETWPCLPGSPPGLSRATAFTLHDQHGMQQAFRLPGDRPSVLFFADQSGSAQLEPWIQPLYERYEERIAIYGVADLSAVPEFLQGVVRLFIRGQLQYPVLLDWTGAISRAYTYDKGQAHVVIVHPHGDILFKTTGAVNKQKLQCVITEIDAILSTHRH
jgi:hypothetical protein